MDPYLAPAAEPVPRGRFDGLRPWLAGTVVLLLLGAAAAIWLIGARQDPSLDVPVEVFGSDAPLTIPEPAASPS